MRYRLSLIVSFVIGFLVSYALRVDKKFDRHLIESPERIVIIQPHSMNEIDNVSHNLVICRESIRNTKKPPFSNTEISVDKPLWFIVLHKDGDYIQYSAIKE